MYEFIALGADSYHRFSKCTAYNNGDVTGPITWLRSPIPHYTSSGDSREYACGVGALAASSAPTLGTSSWYVYDVYWMVPCFCVCVLALGADSYHSFPYCTAYNNGTVEGPIVWLRSPISYFKSSGSSGEYACGVGPRTASSAPTHGTSSRLVTNEYWMVPCLLEALGASIRYSSSNSENRPVYTRSPTVGKESAWGVYDYCAPYNYQNTTVTSAFDMVP